MNLPRRVAGLLTNPAEEWRAIAAEPHEIGGLYRGYVAILAAIPSASILVGLLAAGGLALGAAALATAATAAAVTYAISLAVPYMAAIVIEHIASRFKSDGTTDQSFALVVFAFTPAWLAGVFYLSVTLSPFVLIGLLYAIYLFFAGLTPMLGTPAEQRVPFTLVVVMTIVFLQTLFGAAASAVKMPYYGF